MKTWINRPFLKIPFLLIFTVGVLAQQPARIQQDVKYLASDALEGRLTGAKGATEAARYIAAEFKRLGLKSLPGSASLQPYLQRFPYVSTVTLGQKNQFLITTAKTGSGSFFVTEKVSIQPGIDWLPLGLSSSATVAGGFAIVGYGITAPELNHNDYAGVNATGRIAIA